MFPGDKGLAACRATPVGRTDSATRRERLTSVCEGRHIQQEVITLMPENILILADWTLAAFVDDTMPPRDPNDDDDDEEEDEEDEESDDEPPVVREPEPEE
jgi:hypothetical protein